ncbi:unnamed protein product [Ceratitis capitata]|uniref:(Mediterranean fruit fly) hypothetical protein n=1 Tax=Ceratitis capitata TaxID=7213 RepID=A0A811UTB4_CERCA|nr:unnamed protein product [Ceratitis capitata]
MKKIVPSFRDLHSVVKHISSVGRVKLPHHAGLTNLKHSNIRRNLPYPNIEGDFCSSPNANQPHTGNAQRNATQHNATERLGNNQKRRSYPPRCGLKSSTNLRNVSSSPAC